MYLNWNEVEEGVRTLHFKISKVLKDQGKSVGLIMGIARGGDVPGIMLSHLFKAPYLSLQLSVCHVDIINYDAVVRQVSKCGPDEVVVIVDDIVDFGNTINNTTILIKDIVCQRSSASAIYACLVRKKKSVTYAPVISAIDTETEDWVVFPWEIDAVS